jgi:hypothetical protein
MTISNPIERLPQLFEASWNADKRVVFAFELERHVAPVVVAAK